MAASKTNMTWAKKSGKKLPAPNAKNSKTAYDKNGLPLPDPKGGANLLGNHPFPAYTGEHVHDQEVRRAKVETLLIKGVTGPYRIARILADGTDPQTVGTDIEAIQTRWAIHGNFSRLKQLRGEAKTRMQLIEERLWEKVDDDTVPHVVQTQALMYLQQAHDRRLLLENLTPKTLPMLVTEAEGADDVESVDSKIVGHAQMLKLAAALAQFAGNRLPQPKDDVVDAEYTEVAPKADE